MNSLKNAAHSITDKLSGKHNTGATAGPGATGQSGLPGAATHSGAATSATHTSAATHQSHANNPNYDWKDTAVDYAQSGGYLPNSGTQQGKIVDQGQTYYDSYEAKQTQRQ